MNKKGQEEIVGFAVIMVIIAVVFLIFLTISIRPDQGDRDSRDVQQFLESSMEITSDCAVNFVPDYERLGELFSECNKGRRCLDGRNSCDVLAENVQEVVESSWQIGPDRPIKGYIFESVYVTNSSGQRNEEKLASISSGSCNGSMSGAEYLIPSFPGRIVNTLDLCY